MGFSAVFLGYCCRIRDGNWIHSIERSVCFCGDIAILF